MGRSCVPSRWKFTKRSIDKLTYMIGERDQEEDQEEDHGRDGKTASRNWMGLGTGAYDREQRKEFVLVTNSLNSS